jgi:superfamily I DNA and RNA helicase
MILLGKYHFRITGRLQAMSKDISRFDSNDTDVDEEEYDDMELLERLETLREDMEELGVTTLEQVNQRIKDLHRELDVR